MNKPSQVAIHDGLLLTANATNRGTGYEWVQGYISLDDLFKLLIEECPGRIIAATTAAGHKLVPRVRHKVMGEVVDDLRNGIVGPGMALHLTTGEKRELAKVLT